MIPLTSATATTSSSSGSRRRSRRSRRRVIPVTHLFSVTTLLSLTVQAGCPQAWLRGPATSTGSLAPHQHWQGEQDTLGHTAPCYTAATLICTSHYITPHGPHTSRAPCLTCQVSSLFKQLQVRSYKTCKPNLQTCYNGQQELGIRVMCLLLHSAFTPLICWGNLTGCCACLLGGAGCPPCPPTCSTWLRL